MKTDKNSKTATTREGHLSKSELERAVPNTNKLKNYEVKLCWTQHNMATVVIEATSLAEAEEMADEIQSDEVDDWNPVDGDLWVDSVEPVQGGQDDE